MVYIQLHRADLLQSDMFPSRIVLCFWILQRLLSCHLGTDCNGSGHDDAEGVCSEGVVVSMWVASICEVEAAIYEAKLCRSVCLSCAGVVYGFGVMLEAFGHG